MNLTVLYLAFKSLIDASIWQTSTCKLGWEVLGVFPKGADGTDINSVDSNKNRTLIVAGDDFNTFSVFRFPVLSHEHQSRRFTGHSEHVVRARFYEKSDDNVYIITCGGNDRTYIQWKQVPA